MRDERRVDPYGLVFGHPLFEDELFPGIREEARERGVRTSHPETFVRLQSVGDVIDRLVPPEDGGAAAAELAEHGRLLYHAYHFWLSGGVVHDLPEDAARALLTATTVPAPRSPLLPPAPAGYVQLPPNLLWGQVDAADPPEPVDGFFWTMAAPAAADSGTAFSQAAAAGATARHDEAATTPTDPADTPAFDRLDVLLALGVRPGRAGFSILAVGNALPDADAADGSASWEVEAARDSGDDFANVLPGGDLGGLFAVTTPAEALKLASRWFRQHATAPAPRANG